MKLFESYDTYIYLDTETTGLDSTNDRIIELAAVVVPKSDPLADEIHFDALIKQDKPIPPTIVELTGISNKMLETGITEIEALKEFGGYIKGRTLLIAYNAQFNLKFMAHAIYRNKDALPGLMTAFNNCDYLDPLTIYRDRHAFPHKLCDAIEMYSLSDVVKNSHRAIDNCLALQKVLEKEKLERDDIEKYINLFGYNPKYGLDKELFKKVRYMEQDSKYHIPLYAQIEEATYQQEKLF